MTYPNIMYCLRNDKCNKHRNLINIYGPNHCVQNTVWSSGYMYSGNHKCD